MLMCVSIQFKGYSREIEQQVKQHEAETSNKKKSVFFFFKDLYSILFLSH